MKNKLRYYKSDQIVKMYEQLPPQGKAAVSGAILAFYTKWVKGGKGSKSRSAQGGVAE